MRNVFDQYSQAENRVTHALVTALNEDRQLLGGFLRELVGVSPQTRPSDLHIVEQQLPEGDEPGEDELESLGIPDAWIFDDDGWCLVVESKVTAAFRPAQIESHFRTARRRGFAEPRALSITPDYVTTSEAMTSIRWRDVYVWLNQYRDKHFWAAQAASYLEIVEARLIELGVFTEGTLTMFAGFQFDENHSYNYLEAKRVLGLAMGELRADERLRDLGVLPSAQGRGAIRGSKDRRVWDMLPLAPAGMAFTDAPHLTLGLHEEWVEAMVTFPNALNRNMRRKIIDLGQEGFGGCIAEIVAQMQPLLKQHSGMVPLFRGIQRRYRTPSIVKSIDATLEFDLRTAIFVSDGPKHQVRWLEAGYGAFMQPNDSNYQIQIGAQFWYRNSPELASPTAAHLLADVWLACRPLLDVAFAR